MKKLFKSSLLAMLTIALAAVTSSCSDENETLMKQIPNDVDFVANLNLLKLSNEFDINVKEGKITLPSELEDLVDSDTEKALETIGKLSATVDIEHLYVFGKVRFSDPYEPQGALIATITDKKGLEKELTEGEAELEKDEEDGYDLYTKDDKTDPVLVVKDDILYIPFTEGKRNAVKMVDKIRESAKEENFTKTEHIAEVFKSDNICNVVVRMNTWIKAIEKIGGNDQTMVGVRTAMAQFKDYWMVMDGNLASKEATMTAKLLKEEDGSVFESPYLKPVSTDFLKYVPSDFNLAFAAGISDKAISEIVKMIDMLTSQLSYSERQIFEPLTAEIKQIDGTISLAMKIDMSSWQALNENNNTPQMIAMIQMKGNAAEETLGVIRSLVSQAGMEAIPTDSMSNEFKICRTTWSGELVNVCTVNAIDGNLFLSTTEINGKQSNSLASSFSGNEAAFVFNIPSFSGLTNGKCTFGLSSSIVQKSGISTAKVSLTKCDESLVEALLNLVKYVPEAEEEYYESRWNNYSDYDYYLADTVAYVEEVAAEPYYGY